MTIIIIIISLVTLCFLVIRLITNAPRTIYEEKSDIHNIVVEIQAIQPDDIKVINGSCEYCINIYRNDLFDKTRLLSETFDYTKDEGLLSKENIKVNWFESEVQVIISKSIGSDKYQKVFTCEY